MMEHAAFATAAPVVGCGPSRRCGGVCGVRASAASGAPEAAVTRRAALRLAAAAAVGAALGRGPAAPANARTKSAMTGDYKVDARRMLEDMKEATALTRGAPDMAEIVGRTRADMNDFVALYRRNNKVSGSTSYSVLYTASNTLSGHYASYGPLYPVPEKRKKRLQQQFVEIERALNRGR